MVNSCDGEALVLKLGQGVAGAQNDLFGLKGLVKGRGKEFLDLGKRQIDARYDLLAIAMFDRSMPDFALIIAPLAGSFALDVAARIAEGNGRRP